MKNLDASQPYHAMLFHILTTLLISYTKTNHLAAVLQTISPSSAYNDRYCEFYWKLKLHFITH